jgi:hypothetical protein
MRKQLHPLVLSIFITSISFLFIACGGGGGGGSSDSSGGSSGRSRGGGDITPPPPDNYILMIMQKADSGASFSLNDLEGTWNYHGLVSGDSPQQPPRWYYGQVSINATGNITPITYFDSAGGTTPPFYSSFYIASDGIVTDQADAHGAMNLGKDLIVINKSDAGFHLQVLQKSGGSGFSDSDFEGIWNNHCIVSGDSPQWFGWERGKLDIDVNGLFAFIYYLSSDPNRPTAFPLEFDVDPTGIVTSYATDISNSFHGAMNSGKNLVVGIKNDARGGYKLCALQKTDSAVNFTLNDLEFTWNFHGISTGDYPHWTGWFNGQLTADANGIITQISYTDSSGGLTPPFDSPLDITSEGILTDQANSSFHGTMNIGKDLIITTMN